MIRHFLDDGHDVRNFLAVLFEATNQIGRRIHGIGDGLNVGHRFTNDVLTFDRQFTRFA